MQKYNGQAPSVSSRAAKLVEGIVADADALRVTVTTGAAGERLIDLGAHAPGGLEAGRRLAEVCLGGLGTVTVHNDSGLKRWPLGITVHAANPVVACLGSGHKQDPFPAQLLGELLGKCTFAAARSAQDQDQLSHLVSSRVIWLSET